MDMLDLVLSPNKKLTPFVADVLFIWSYSNDGLQLLEE